MSARIETELAEYTNQYPRNTGHVAQRYISFVFILLGVALLCLSIGSNDDVAFLGGLSLTGGITMWAAYSIYRKKHDTESLVEEQKVRDEIQEMRSMASDYEEVLRYCDVLDKRLAESSAQKKKSQPAFFLIVGVILAAILLICPFYKIKKFEPPVNDYLFTVMAQEPGNQYGDSMQVELGIDLNSLSTLNSDTIINMNVRIQIYAVVKPGNQIKGYQLAFIDSTGIPAPMAPVINFTDGTGLYYCQLPVFNAVELKNRLKEGKLKYLVNPIYDK